jgi:hypothetical protein
MPSCSSARVFPEFTGFPGYLIDPTAARGKALSGLCIDMHAGELDLFDQFEEARRGCHPGK